MKLMNDGDSISNKSKHMRVRYFYIKEKIDESIIHLKYTKTNEMIADLLTKPLFGKQFEIINIIPYSMNIVGRMVY